LGAEIKLTDRELPASPEFIDFLHHLVAGIPFTGAVWGDQLSATLSRDQRRLRESVTQNAPKVLAAPLGPRARARAHEVLLGLLTGIVALTKDIQLRFHVVAVLGVPRNLGSCLTKEIYRALGFSADQVPDAIAHDGFPEAGPFRFEPGVNSWNTCLQAMAEFPTMVGHFWPRPAARRQARRTQEGDQRQLRRRLLPARARPDYREHPDRAPPGNLLYLHLREIGRAAR
jgi:hypothetical protein